MCTAAVAAGVGLAACAAACFDGAVAWQALEVRGVPAEGGRTRLLGRLVRRPRWLAATGLALLGWPLQVAALSLAPLTVVQPTLALGLVLLLFLGSRLLGERVGRAERLGVAAIVIGLGVLAWAAPERRAVAGNDLTIVVAAAGLGAVALVPWLARDRVSGITAAIGAGCAFAFTALTSKLLSDALARGDWAIVLGAAAATAPFALIGLADEMTALQRIAATRVAPTILVVEVVTPVLLAPIVAGEGWSHTPGGGVLVAVGLAIVAAGAIPLATAVSARE
jgi:drug/metabolite transporter (DMT)-like permease